MELSGSKSFIKHVYGSQFVRSYVRIPEYVYNAFAINLSYAGAIVSVICGKKTCKNVQTNSRD